MSDFCAIGRKFKRKKGGFLSLPGLKIVQGLRTILAILYVCDCVHISWAELFPQLQNVISDKVDPVSDSYDD